MAKEIAITLKKSVIGSNDKQRATVEALGLKKIRQTVIQQDTEAIRGMINKVSHLVEIHEA